MSMHTRAQLHLRSDPGWVYQSACTGGSRGLQTQDAARDFLGERPNWACKNPASPPTLLPFLCRYSAATSFCARASTKCTHPWLSPAMMSCAQPEQAPHHCVQGQAICKRGLTSSVNFFLRKVRHATVVVEPRRQHWLQELHKPFTSATIRVIK